MITQADFKNMPEAYKAAGETICEYIKAINEYDDVDYKDGELGHDIVVLEHYLSNEASDHDLECIQRLADQHAAVEDDYGLMNFSSARDILVDLTNEQKVNHGNLTVLAGKMRTAKFTAINALRAALRSSRKTHRLDYKSDRGYLELRDHLSLCLTEKKNERIALNRMIKAMSPDVTAKFKQEIMPDNPDV